MIFAPPGHHRVVFETWYRDPKGPILPKPPPAGKRPPNGIIWGNDLDSFFWTWRIPYLNALAIWSRSMIQDFGENHFQQEELEDFEPDPYLINPYSLLFLGDNDRSGDGTDAFNTAAEDAMSCECSTNEGAGSVPAHAEDILPSVPDESSDREAVPDMHVDNPTPINEELCLEGVGPPPTDNGAQNKDRPEVASIPKLEELIPGKHFPDILLVNDPDRVTDCSLREALTTPCDWSARQPIQYKRMMPTVGPSSTESTHISERTIEIADSDVQRIAHLRISGRDLLGVGNHSLVYCAAFTPPSPLAADTPTGETRVAVKLAFPQTSARNMLKREAGIYNKFPKHLMETWSGYNLVLPHKFPVPVDPVVPKFFGYYVPADQENNSLSPILLLEECGTPIIPEKLNPDQQSQCYTHVLRLHCADFIQNSIAARNITMQPGPLNVHPDMRSLNHPSFRIIDFGRAEFLNDWLMETHEVAKLPADPVDAEVKCRKWRFKLAGQESELRKALIVDWV